MTTECSCRLWPSHGDVTDHFIAVGQTDPWQPYESSRVRLLRGRRIHTGAYAAASADFLLQRGNLVCALPALARLADQLVYSWHVTIPLEFMFRPLSAPCLRTIMRKTRAGSGFCRKAHESRGRNQIASCVQHCQFTVQSETLFEANFQGNVSSRRKAPHIGLGGR